MSFITIRKGAHHQDRAYLLQKGGGYFWTPRIDEATRFETEEEAAAPVQASPAGPAFEGGVTFETATAPEITTNFGPFGVAASIAATGRKFYFAFDGVTASWPSSPGLALRLGNRKDAETIVARLSAGDGPATAALTAAGLPLANPVEFDALDLGAPYGRAV